MYSLGVLKTHLNSKIKVNQVEHVLTYALRSENPLKSDTDVCSTVTWLSRFLVSAFSLFSFFEFCSFCISSSDICLWQ